MWDLIELSYVGLMMLCSVRGKWGSITIRNGMPSGDHKLSRKEKGNYDLIGVDSQDLIN